MSTMAESLSGKSALSGKSEGRPLNRWILLIGIIIVMYLFVAGGAAFPITSGWFH